MKPWAKPIHRNAAEPCTLCKGFHWIVKNLATGQLESAGINYDKMAKGPHRPNASPCPRCRSSVHA